MQGFCAYFDVAFYRTVHSNFRFWVKSAMIPSMKSITKTHSISLLIVLLPIMGYHAGILCLSGVICGGDFINQFVPWRNFAIREWVAGCFPGWNPFMFCGAPFSANIQTALLYPINILHLLFPTERVFSLSLVFHHMLAAVGMYGFIYSLYRNQPGAVIGALVYAWSGFLITHAHDGHIIHVIAYSWIPFALWCQNGFRSRWHFGYILGFSITLTAMFFGGHTQIPLYIFYVVMFRSLWWGIQSFLQNKNVQKAVQPVFATGVGLALSILLSLPVLLPLYQLSKQTAGRAGGAAYSFAVSDSMPPGHLLTLVAPFFYGDPTAADRESQFWETTTGYHEICGYTGVLPIVLFLLIWTRRSSNRKRYSFTESETLFFGILAAVGVFFALGEYNPLYPVLYYGLPGWSFFRVPGRLLLLWIIGVSVCSARGWQMINSYKWSALQTQIGLKLSVVFSVIVFVLTVILLVMKESILSSLREFEVNRTMELFNLPPASRLNVNLGLPQVLFETRYEHMLQAGILACAVLIVGWLGLILHNRLKYSWSWLPIAVLISIDLLLFSHRFIEVKPLPDWRETYYPQTELVQFLQENSEGYRVLCLDDAIGNPGLETHPELRPNRLMNFGIESARGYDPLINQTYTRWVNRMYGNPPDAPQGGLLFFPGLQAQQTDALNIMNVKYVVTTQPLPEPFSVAWSEDKSPIKIYENPQCFERVFWEIPSPDNRIEIMEQTTQSITVKVISNVMNRLVYSQVVYPGWTVQVDGADYLLEAYQDTFLSVSLPVGEHEVRFSFQQTWLP